MIQITLNQETQQIPSGINLQQLITQLSLSEQGCVFAINNAVVPRSAWESTILTDGDAISLFQAIAGG